jgi:4-alpha-glucanotransferase
VLRWEREWDKEDKPFIDINKFNRDSMTTLSTHDSETVAQWWLDKPEEASAYAKKKGWNYLNSNPISIEQLEELLVESHTSASLFHINLFQDILALTLVSEHKMVREDPKEERINIPGTTSNFNWSYRVRNSITEIDANNELNTALARIVDSVALRAAKEPVKVALEVKPSS